MPLAKTLHLNRLRGAPRLRPNLFLRGQTPRRAVCVLLGLTLKSGNPLMLLCSCWPALHVLLARV